MPTFQEISVAAPWLLPSTFSILGVLIGSSLTLLIQRSQARRANRRELVISTIEELTKARSLATQRLAQHGTGRMIVQPIVEAESATALWVRFEMLAALERRAADQRALAANGMVTHEMLMGGSRTPGELESLRLEMQRQTLILLAWDRRRAHGRDFRLSFDDVYRKFGPKYSDADLPR